MKKYISLIVLIFALIAGLWIYSQKQGSAPQRHDMENKTNSLNPDSYEVEVVEKPSANEIILNEPTNIKYKIKNDKDELVKDFAIAHEKIMHFIIVRKDLTQFEHLHPDYNKETGEFSVNATFTVDGPYRFFADFTPEKDNPQKLPVTVHSDMNVGDVSGFQPHPVTPVTSKQLAVPPDYQVTYSLPSELKSQSSVTYSLTVERNGQPVTLEKYLGALGHSVALKEGSLNYIHTHAGEQDMSMQIDHGEHEVAQGNKINFTTTFPEPGIYRIFTQFQEQGNVTTSEYTAEVQ